MLEPRLARGADYLLLWQWVNDPEVRQWSFSSAPIGLEEHHQWFSKSLADPNCTILVFERGGQPIGQVRFNLVQESRAEVHISVEKSSRGRGFGGEMLRKACAQVFRVWPISEVCAHVKEGNNPSLRVFEKAGFMNRGEMLLRQSRCWELVLPRKGAG